MDIITYLLAKSYTKKEIAKIRSLGIELKVEQDRSILQRTGEQKVLYLIPKEETKESDYYDEYVYTTQWEKIGSTQIDLTNYYTKEETDDLLEDKQDEITSSNKLDSDLVDDTNSTHKFVTAQEKETWNNIKTLRPMKTAWLNASTTEEAVEMMLDDGVQKGDGYLGTVRWGDLPSPLQQAECKGFVITDSIILFELNSADIEPYNWQYNSYAGEWRTMIEGAESTEHKTNVLSSSSDAYYNAPYINALIGVVTELENDIDGLVGE